MQAAQAFGDEPQRRAEEAAFEAAPTRVLPRRDQELVRQPAPEGRKQHETVALEHYPLSAFDLDLHVLADRAGAWRFLGLDGRGRLGQPCELRVAVRQARACLTALVEQRVDVAEAGVAGCPGAFSPGRRHG